VEVYKNGVLLGVRSVSSWQYYAGGGRIGLWFVDVIGATFDDFGGGNLSGGEGMMAQGSGFMKSGSSEAGDLLQTLQTLPKPRRTPLSTSTPTLTPTVPPPAGQGAGLNFAPVSFKLPAPVSAPLQQSGAVTITYEYDPLYRLTEANYSTGESYHYTYDAVGNRKTQETLIGSVPLTTNYVYDNANRLTSVDGVNYTWDNNGNLLDDGVNSYAYNAPNQLTAMSGPFGSSTFAYNGLGDRLTQNGVNYTLDLNSGLTQVLNDGTNQYLYGVGRIAQVNTTTLITDYFITDALGSVRQLTDAGGEITLAKSYAPYGEVTLSAGDGTSPFAFTGEQVDVSGGQTAAYNYFLHHDGLFLDHLFPKWHYVFAVDFLHGESLRLNRFQDARGGNAQDFQSLTVAERFPIVRNDDQVNVAPFASGPCRLRAVEQDTRRANPQFRQLLAVSFDDAFKFACCFNH
jgi:YD repeat-containing protein